MRRTVTAGLTWIAVVVCVAVGSGSSWAQSRPRPPLAFDGEGDLAVTGSAPTKVKILNNSDQPQTVTMSARLPSARTSTGTTADAASVLVVTSPVVLAAHQSADVEIVTNPTVKLAEGTYRGVLVATSDVEGISVERGVQLTVPKASLPAALPGLDKWLAISYRGQVVPLAERGHTLVLKEPAAGATLPKTLGFLSDDSGRSVRVSGTLTADASAVNLHFSGHEHPGTYQGTLDFTPADTTTGTVSLTLRRTDDVGLAIMAIATGLAMAFFGQRAFGVSRQLWQQKRHARRALQTIKEGDEAFALYPPAFSLAASAQAVYDELESALKKLRRRFVLSIDTTSPEYKAADRLRVSLEDAAKVWVPDQALAWSNLRTNLAGLDPGEPPPGALKDRPQWVLTAERLLGGAPLKITEVAKRVATLEATTELFSRWSPLQEMLTKLGDRIATLRESYPNMAPSDQRLFERARRLVNGVGWDAWHAEDPGDFLARAAEAELDQADAAIGQLSGYLAAQGEDAIVARATDLPRGFTRHLAGAYIRGWDRGIGDADLVNVLSRPTGATTLPFPLPIPALAALRGITSRAGGAERAMRPVFDAGVVALLVAAAIWAGLVALYFDKSFGSARDYIAALTWGLATKGALDSISSVLGKLSSPLPSTTPGAPAATAPGASTTSASTTSPTTTTPTS